MVRAYQKQKGLQAIAWPTAGRIPPAPLRPDDQSWLHRQAASRDFFNVCAKNNKSSGQKETSAGFKTQGLISG
jgi:hypothetical protein